MQIAVNRFRRHGPASLRCTPAIVWPAMVCVFILLPALLGTAHAQNQQDEHREALNRHFSVSWLTGTHIWHQPFERPWQSRVDEAALERFIEYFALNEDEAVVARALLEDHTTKVRALVSEGRARERDFEQKARAIIAEAEAAEQPLRSDPYFESLRSNALERERALGPYADRLFALDDEVRTDWRSLLDEDQRERWPHFIASESRRLWSWHLASTHAARIDYVQLLEEVAPAADEIVDPEALQSVLDEWGLSFHGHSISVYDLWMEVMGRQRIERNERFLGLLLRERNEAGEIIGETPEERRFRERWGVLGASQSELSAELDRVSNRIRRDLEVQLQGDARTRFADSWAEALFDQIDPYRSSAEHRFVERVRAIEAIDDGQREAFNLLEHQFLQQRRALGREVIRLTEAFENFQRTARERGSVDGVELVERQNAIIRRRMELSELRQQFAARVRALLSEEQLDQLGEQDT